MTLELKRQYPEEYEFVGFFEAEPDVTDEDVAWYYNTLVYRTDRGEFGVECTLSPACGDMDLKISLRGREMAALSVSFIEKIHFEMEKGKDVMVIGFLESSKLRPLLLRLKPTVNLSWGTELQ